MNPACSARHGPNSEWSGAHIKIKGYSEEPISMPLLNSGITSLLLSKSITHTKNTYNSQ